ncbi:unnamed protein product [Blepharisma stoltei]|uniref:PA domain-containing protein n=1 Tax=Blepharisma stoltei TaxID=1481888 RepID=A0AAU9IBU9_9CILI|nr:unnamed protein product [Blepharisma stoltei]
MYFLFLLISVAFCKILVYAPAELKEAVRNRYSHSGLKSSLANFGNPPYGSSIVGRVFYREAEKLACDAITPFNWNDEESINSPILLVERGDCPFVVKARHAQDIGAKALIVIDNREENPENVIMIDSGTGGNIYIPTLLISESDGNLLKLYLEEKKEAVSLMLSFEVPYRDGHINYDIWMSSENVKIQNFLHQFYNVGAKLTKKQATFVPHYVLWYCDDCANHGFTSDNSNCVSGGRYCAPDPDGNGPRTGRDVVIENLRQICIYKQTENDQDYSLWFKYMKSYNTTCEDMEACTEKFLKDAGIDHKKIKKCMDDSFIGNKRPILDDNTLLRDEFNTWGKLGLSFYPALIVNNFTYRGDWESSAILKALCAGYGAYQEPDLCSQDQSPEKAESSNSTIIFILILSFALIGAIAVFYRMWMNREMKEEMRVQVNSTVNQYFAMSDSPRNRRS